MRVFRQFVFFAPLALAGCVGNLPFMSDPLDEVEKLSDVQVAEDVDAVAIVAPAEAPGFFGRLLGRGSETDSSNIDSALAEAVAPPEDAAPDVAIAAVDTAAAAEDDATTEPAPDRGGLFGFLGRVTQAGAGGQAANVTAPDPDQVAPMTMQAFGEVGKTCGLSRRDLGTEIANVSGFRVYDTFPNSTAARPHYITGFDDRCARQFTAALVLTGDVGTHEVVRYQGSGRNLPYTTSDQAYEQIKASFCGVGQGKPCGRRLDALARNTTFVTAYESFASSPVWADILLHDGTFVAVSVETR